MDPEAWQRLICGDAVGAVIASEAVDVRHGNLARGEVM